MRLGWRATGVALVLVLAASGCGDEDPDDSSPADATTEGAGQNGDGITVATGAEPSTTEAGSGSTLAEGADALCPMVDELNAAAGAATTEREVAESATRVACLYRRPGPGGSQVAWSIEVSRYVEENDAAFSFGVARRTDISEETPLPADVRLGDEAAYGRSAGDILIVRMGADVVQIESVAQPAPTMEDMIAVFELVAGAEG